MKYRNFYKLNKEVSQIGYGAFGLKGVFGAFDASEAIGSMHYCWEKGVNLIDTARHYGDSEAIIGKALKSWSGEKPFIASKAECIGPQRQWGTPVPVEQAFPKGHITKEVEDSLKALGVDSIDLYQMHIYWPNWGTEGYWLDELNAAQEAGKIGAVGVSIPDQRSDIVLPLVLSGRIDSVQTVMNIFDPTPLDCMVPLCQENRVAVIARCVLDEGGLTGTLKRDTQFAPDDFRAGYFDEGPRDRYIQKVDALRKFIPEHAETLAALALKFVVKHPGVTTALSSMNIQKFAEENVRALEEEPLNDEVFEELRFYHRWVHNFYGAKAF